MARLPATGGRAFLDAEVAMRRRKFIASLGVAVSGIYLALGLRLESPAMPVPSRLLSERFLQALLHYNQAVMADWGLCLVGVDAAHYTTFWNGPGPGFQVLGVT